jgi:hypothetical protein
VVNAGDIIRASDVAVQACRVARSTVQSIPDATVTLVTFNSEIFDPTAMHSTVSNTSRVTIAEAGYYIVGFGGRFPSANDYVVTQAHIVVNGVDTIALAQFPGSSIGIPQRVFISTMDEFSAGDYVEVSVYQDNTANAARNLEVVVGQSPEFWVARIGS